jgi:hypothetical protein
MVIEMKKNEIYMRKAISYSPRPNSIEEEHLNMTQEDKELYMFLRGGFAAK